MNQDMLEKIAEEAFNDELQKIAIQAQKLDKSKYPNIDKWFGGKDFDGTRKAYRELKGDTSEGIHKIFDNLRKRLKKL